MSGWENVIPLSGFPTTRGSVSPSDRGIVGVRSDLSRPSRLLDGSVEPPFIAGGEVEASEADRQAGDEGGDSGDDDGHQAG